MKNIEYRFIRKMLALLSAASASLMIACGDKTTVTDAGNSSPEAATSLLEGIQVMDTKPTGAIPVKAARERLEPGDDALVYGQIGGVANPFLNGYAGFVMADTEVMFCDEMEDDKCPSPWDACCEDTEKLKKSRASVQFVDAEGQVMTGSLEGFVGLAGLSHVIVQGEVAPGSTRENLIIQAKSIYKAEP